MLIAQQNHTFIVHNQICDCFYNCCLVYFFLKTSLVAQTVKHLSTMWEGDLGSSPGLGRSPAEGNGNPLQDSCLENPMDREAWRAIVHGVTRVRHDLATSPPPPPSLFLELLLYCSPVVYWTPTELGSLSFIVLSFCLFILFMGFSRQEY